MSMVIPGRSESEYEPYPKYKDSGVGWLGEIPDGWDVRKLKYVGQAILGLTYQPSDVVDESPGILVLRSSNIQNGRLSMQDNVYVKTQIPKKLITRIGDILICSRNGSRDLIGKNAKIMPSAVGKTGLPPEKESSFSVRLENKKGGNRWSEEDTHRSRLSVS